MSRTGLILLYHRVANRGQPDPWGLCVSPERFEGHLSGLREQGCTFCSVHELLAAWPTLRGGGRIAVAFDDGYGDNARVAAPILERLDVPATFFVVSGAVGSSHEFWWDHLERLILSARVIPETLAVIIGGRVHRWETVGTSMVGGREAARDAIYQELWNLMRSMSAAERMNVLSQLEALIPDAPSPDPDSLPMNCDTLTRLAGHSLFEIGAHTVSHPTLGLMSSQEQEREIRCSKIQLEDIIGRPVRSFSYPHGSYSPATLDAVEAAGFEFACTTRAGSVAKGQNPYLLPRCFVGDWEPDEFARNTKHWARS